MREILFRGKLLSTGEWTEGNLSVTKSGVAIISPDDTPIGKYGQVDPETVGQYIGLTDENGKKIFEGDVLEREWTYSPTERIVISYSNSSFAYTSLVSAFSNDISDPVDDYEYGINTELYKIVGNIHDNPELIERYMT